MQHEFGNSCLQAALPGEYSIVSFSEKHSLLFLYLTSSSLDFQNSFVKRQIFTSLFLEETVLGLYKNPVASETLELSHLGLKSGGPALTFSRLSSFRCLGFSMENI